MSREPRTAEAAYDIPSAAALKSVGPDYIRKAIRAGDLRAVKVGRGYRINASALEAWWAGLEQA